MSTKSHDPPEDNAEQKSSTMDAEGENSDEKDEKQVKDEEDGKEKNEEEVQKEGEKQEEMDVDEKKEKQETKGVYVFCEVQLKSSLVFQKTDFFKSRSSLPHQDMHITSMHFAVN